jgi:peptide/nickel transport system substrate-binding protein
MKLRSTPHPYRKPIATELRYIVVPDIGQQVVGLRTGEIDIANATFTAVQLDQLKSEKFNIATREVQSLTALFSQPEAEARNSPLKDKRVRQAINYAVNKEALINALFKGLAVPASQLPLQSSLAYNNSLKAYPYDPARAKQLLSEAGYPDGFKLPKGIGFSGSTDVPVILQQDLKAVGVDAPLNQYEFAVVLDQYYGRNGAQKDDLFLVTGGDPNGTFSLNRGLFACDKEGFQTWFCSPEFVRLYDQSVSETNPQRRTELLQQSVAALMNDVPVLLIYYKDGTTAMSPNVRGFSWPMPTWYELDGVYRVG